MFAFVGGLCCLLWRISKEPGYFFGCGDTRNVNIYHKNPTSSESEVSVSYPQEGPKLWDFPKIRGALFWGPYNMDSG